MDVQQVPPAVNSATERFERRLVEEASSLRVQIAQMETRLTDKMSGLLKWSFLFWVGQVVAMTAIMNAMLRTR